MEPTTISFLDLDRTLYQTDSLLKIIREDLITRGYAVNEIDQHITELSHAGEYTFERHLRLLGMSGDELTLCVTHYRELQQRGDTLLYNDVLPALPRLAHLSACELLTFGQPEYQRDKFSGISSIQPYFRRQHYVHHNRTKGDVIRHVASNIKTWLLDDSPAQLLDVRQKSPTTQLVRIMRSMDRPSPHLGDGTIWHVVPNFEAFVNLVEAG